MTKPFRILILCTGNSARSQMAEAIINHRGKGRVVAESAGSQPAKRVNPWAIETLRDAGIEWHGHAPRGTEGLEEQRWDVVITVCDNAKESCPVFPGQPLQVHWGMPDPADVEGSDEEVGSAFFEAFLTLSRRIELLLALPVQTMERGALETMLRAIGTTP
ncbi:MAG: arsenate reductase ArsC [Gemmatimonadota bacterium]